MNLIKVLGIFIIAGTLAAAGKLILLDCSFIPNQSDYTVNLDEVRNCANSNVQNLPL